MHRKLLQHVTVVSLGGIYFFVAYIIVAPLATTQNLQYLLNPQTFILVFRIDCLDWIKLETRS